MLDKLICSLNLNYKKDPRSRQRLLQEDNNNTGAEQSLTKRRAIRTEARKRDTKNPLGEKRAGNLGRNHGSCSCGW